MRKLCDCKALYRSSILLAASVEQSRSGALFGVPLTDVWTPIEKPILCVLFVSSVSSVLSWPRASRNMVLPVPDGPHTTRFFLLRTHSRVRRADWVGAGMEEAAGSQDSQVLPVGKAAAARRVAREERSRPTSSSPKRISSTSAGSQRWARAVAMTSGAARRM